MRLHVLLRTPIDTGNNNKPKLFARHMVEVLIRAILVVHVKIMPMTMKNKICRVLKRRASIDHTVRRVRQKTSTKSVVYKINKLQNIRTLSVTLRGNIV